MNEHLVNYGLKVIDPTRTLRLIVPVRKEYTEAEKRFGKLLNKLRRRIELRNKFITYGISLIVGCLLLIFSLFFLFYIKSENPLLSLELGIIVYLISSLVWYWADDYFPTDMSYKSIKRKNKTYYL